MTGMDKETRFAIKVKCKEVRSHASLSVMTKEGEEFWIVNAEWCPTTSSERWLRGRNLDGIMTWDTREEAEEFASSWGGHPWYCVPRSWEVVEVRERLVTVQQGWEVQK